MKKNTEHLFKIRLGILSMIFVGFFMIILLQLINLQIIQFKEYNNKAQKNYLKSLEIKPKRGLIYDRNNKVLAENRETFFINLEKEDDDIRSFLNIKDQSTMTYEVNKTDIIKLKSNPNFHDRIHIEEKTIRHYPYGKYAFSVVGYGTMLDNEFQPANGIEKQYNELLSGRSGFFQYVTDARGSQIPTSNLINEQNGNDIHLTIDMDLQKIAYQSLNASKGAVVILNPKNGEVLALVSKPTIDPNDIKNLFANPNSLGIDQPLFNRVISGLFSPGSTIKPFYALAGLESKVITNKTVIKDDGYLMLGGHKFHDVNKNGHGHVDLQKAIAVSCDTFFYKLGLKLGIDRMHQTLTNFGLGHKTGIDLPNEAPGLVPSKAWKRETKHQPWYGGDTVITAIGQGALLTTPIQLAQATSSIANRGFFYYPHILKSTTDFQNQDHDIIFQKHPIGSYKSEYYEIIDRSMRDAMQRGTGYHSFSGSPYAIAGKTGTTQITSHIHTRELGVVPKNLADHSLFVGYAPNKKPEIVIVVLVENYEMSASRVAKNVLDYYFNKRKQNNVITI
ncbi:MAG: penicillin-binding protein 2 [Pseudomonadota bacterium]|nr:penicillin-binding protein 2 [Pseudomonadota bacterium]